MPHSYRGKRLTLGTQATYRINVQGCLNGSWSDRLSGMRIIAHNPKEQASVTTLEGRVRSSWWNNWDGKNRTFNAQLAGQRCRLPGTAGAGGRSDGREVWSNGIKSWFSSFHHFQYPASGDRGYKSLDISKFRLY
jgi:hypothetical protein